MCIHGEYSKAKQPLIHFHNKAKGQLNWIAVHDDNTTRLFSNKSRVLKGINSNITEYLP